MPETREPALQVNVATNLHPRQQWEQQQQQQRRQPQDVDNADDSLVEPEVDSRNETGLVRRQNQAERRRRNVVIESVVNVVVVVTDVKSGAADSVIFDVEESPLREEAPRLPKA